MNKQAIIYLVHRLPFPPDKGDKIRSYNILRYLADHYDVHLGCFIDDPDDVKHVETLSAICSSTCIETINPAFAKLKILPALFSNSSLSFQYYRSRRLSEWSQKLVAEQSVCAALAFSSPMAQFLRGPTFRCVRRVIDFVDVDSDKWRQFASRKSGPMAWVYQREANYLAREEREIAEVFDASTLVSAEEAALFASLNPSAAQKTFALLNGVDCDYFDPDLSFASPFTNDEPKIVFTGLMSYWPNVDAVTWFVNDVLPELQTRIPDAEFWIVGGAPSREVQGLGERKGVFVTGRVPDVRPYLAHAHAVVAPLRVARGIQNKVLEALAMRQTVVCTSDAATGIEADTRSGIRIANNAKEFVDETLREIERMKPCSYPSAREFVLREFSWTANLALLDELMTSSTPA